MIFQHTYQQIPTGEKTATRRPFGLGQSLKDGALYSSTGRKLHWVGQTVSVQPGRGKKAVGTIRITALYEQKLHDMTEADAQAEGCEAFWWSAYWEGWETLADGTRMHYSHGAGKNGDAPADPEMEGAHYVPRRLSRTALETYARLWDKIHGAGAWNKNDLIWCAKFECLEWTPGANPREDDANP